MCRGGKQLISYSTKLSFNITVYIGKECWRCATRNVEVKHSDNAKFD